MVWLEKDALMENLDVSIEFVMENLRDINTTKKLMTEVRLICEEVLINTISYGYEGETGKMRVGYEVDRDCQVITLVFENDGSPFDPTQKEDPDVTLDIMSRNIGGLGIFMVKKLSDRITYARENGSNVLTITKSYLREAPYEK